MCQITKGDAFGRLIMYHKWGITYFCHFDKPLFGWDNPYTRKCGKSLRVGEQVLSKTKTLKKHKMLLFWTHREEEFRKPPGALQFTRCRWAGTFTRAPLGLCLCVKGGIFLRAALPPSPPLSSRPLLPVSLSPSRPTPACRLSRSLGAQAQRWVRGMRGCWSIRIGQQCHRIEQQWTGL